MKKNYNRNFKIEGREFQVRDINGFDYKYAIDVLNTSCGGWQQVRKANTLAEAKQEAYDYIEYLIEDMNNTL